MLSVVRVVILEHEGGDVVESVHHAAFVVEVREAQRAGNLRHAIFLAEGDDGLDEGLGDLLVVDEVNPAEAHFLVVPVPVGNLVDDGGYAAHDFPVFVGQELGALGVLGHGVLGRIQGRHFVEIYVGDVERASLIEFEGEFDEGFQLSLGLHFLNGNGHMAYRFSYSLQI